MIALNISVMMIVGQPSLWIMVIDVCAKIEKRALLASESNNSRQDETESDQ